jgi:hypothetical protein
LLTLVNNNRNLKNLWLSTAEISKEISNLLQIDPLKVKDTNTSEDTITQENLESSVDIFKQSSWQIGYVKLDKNKYIISAQNLATKKAIYKKDWKIVWYNFEWINEIENIKPLKMEGDKIISLELRSWDWYFYYNFIDWKYQQVKIEWYSAATELTKIEYDNNNLIKSGLIWTWYSVGGYFYKIDWKYKSIITTFNFERLEKIEFDSKWMPLYLLTWAFWKYIYRKNWKYYELPWELSILYVDKNYIPVYCKTKYDGVFIFDEDTKEYRKKWLLERNPHKKRTDLIQII